MAEAYPSSQIRHFRLNSSGTGPTSLFDEISQTNFECGEYVGDNFNGFGPVTGSHILGSSGTIDTDQLGWKTYFEDLTLALPSDAPGSSTDFMVDMHFAPGGFDRDFFHPFFQFELTTSAGATRTFLDFGYFVNTTAVGGGSTDYNVNVRWSCRRYDVYTVSTSGGLSSISTKLLSEYLHDTGGQFIHQVIPSSDYTLNPNGGADLTNIDHVDFTTSNINNWRHKIYREGSAWKWYVNNTLKASFSLSTAVIGCRFGGVGAYANRSFTQQTYLDRHGYGSGSYEEFWVKSGTLSTDDKAVDSNEEPFYIVKTGASSLTSETQESITGKNNISGTPTGISSDVNFPNVTAANTVAFPNPQYVADTYVDDTYVGIIFDAQMEQVFSSRDTLSALGGRAQYGSASVTSDHQTTLSGGRIRPATTLFNSDAQVLTSAGRIRSTTYTFDSINQFSSLGGNAIEGVLSALSDSQIAGTATVEIIPDANTLADSQINTVAGYLQPSGSLILGTDAQYTIDQTLGTTAGIRFNGASSIASDHATSLVGGLNLKVTTNLSTENAIQIIGGYLKQLSATFDVDHDWYAQPTLYESTAQAVLNSETQTSLLINVTFTARDTTLNTDHQFTSIGRILQAVDPYRAIDIASELRKIIIQAETRTEAMDNESRINKINQETRLDTIDSETRKVYVYDDKTIIRRTNRRVGDRI